MRRRKKQDRFIKHKINLTGCRLTKELQKELNII